MIRVLVVDDQPLVRSGFRMVLEERPDLELVGEAADGAEALELARELDPDVILMDVRMPNLDGVEATRQLVESGTRARILVLTTFDLDEYVYAAIRAGASGFLLKDVEPAELVDAIRVVAAGNSLFGPAATERLVARFSQQPAPDARPLARRADRARAGDPHAARERPLERGARREALPQRDDGEDARLVDPAEAARARPRAGGHRRVRRGPRQPEMTQIT